MRAIHALRQLERALERLAWEGERQIQHLSRCRVGADEFALEFDDAIRVVSGMVGEGLIPSSVREAVRPVDQSLAYMTTAASDEWTEAAVRGSRAWSDLRRTAHEAMNAVHEAQFEVD